MSNRKRNMAKRPFKTVCAEKPVEVEDFSYYSEQDKIDIATTMAAYGAACAKEAKRETLATLSALFATIGRVF